jgi:hypothetical protein
MSVLAEQLKDGILTSGKISKIIAEQIEIIDNRLLKIDKKMGLNTLKHNMPIITSEAGLDKEETQLYIYAAIINSLTERGFTVHLKLNQAADFIMISWTATLDKKIRESCINTIKRETSPNNSSSRGFYYDKLDCDP